MPDRGLPAGCGGCGCVCDDVRVAGASISPACAPGAAWFSQRLEPALPPSRIDGREADPDAALDAAAGILAQADTPLVYGLARTSVEAARSAVGLADRLGALVEPAGAVRDGAGGRAVALRGASTATLGEIRDRAATVVVWREDPLTTHPRLLERLRLDEAQRGARRLVVVDDRETATARSASLHLRVPATGDLDALLALRAAARGLPARAVGALTAQAARRLVDELRGAQNAALLHGSGLAAQPGGHRRVLALHELVRDLSDTCHLVTLALRRDANAAGAEDVLTWQTGFPSAVDLASGAPRSFPGPTSAATRLRAGEVDAVLSVAGDPVVELGGVPAGVPIVALDAVETATTRAARVVFGTAAVGIGAAGTVHRLDGVPVALHAVAAQARPGDDELLRALAARLGGEAQGC